MTKKPTPAQPDAYLEGILARTADEKAVATVTDISPSPVSILMDALLEGDVESVQQAPGSVVLFAFFELRTMLNDDEMDQERVELALDVLAPELDRRLKPLK